MLEAAVALLRSSGYEGTGINRVIAYSGAPKGSLYHFFPGGKDQLVSEALEQYGGRIAAQFDAAMAAATTPRAKVEALFRMIERRLEAGDFNQSCAAGTVALDLNEDLEGLREVVSNVLRAWTGVIERHLQVPDPSKRRSLAGMILTCIEGGYLRGRAERSTVALREAGEWMATLVERQTQDDFNTHGGRRRK